MGVLHVMLFFWGALGLSLALGALVAKIRLWLWRRRVMGAFRRPR